MSQRHKSREITSTEYRNWLAQQHGYKDKADYEWHRRNGLLKPKEETMHQKYISGKITRTEYKDWRAISHGFKDHYEEEYFKRWGEHKSPEKSMNAKYKSGEILGKEYHDWCAHKKGYEDHAEYLNRWAIAKGYNTYKKYDRAYRRTEQGILNNKKACAKRKRELGYIVLNNWFKGCEGHHIDKNYVIHIPKELHKAQPHRLKDEESMKLINILAFDYMNSLIL